MGVILGILIEDGILGLFWNNLGIANQGQCVNNENILEDNMCYVEKVMKIIYCVVTGWVVLSYTISISWLMWALAWIYKSWYSCKYDCTWT